MNRFTQLIAFALGGALAFTGLQSLSACSQGQVSIDQVVRAFGGNTLDANGQRALKRFFETYDLYTSNSNDIRHRDHFRDAFMQVRAKYVVQVNDDKLIDAALKGVTEMEPKPGPGAVEPEILVEAALDGMMASLDPHSSYLNSDEYKESNVFTKGEFGGLGIEVTMEEGVIKVISPIEDTPAFHAGVQAGDLITHLDGSPIKGMTLTDAVKIMRGRPGTGLTLTILRKGKPPFDIAVVRAVIVVRSVRWHLEGDIGYVRVMKFSEQVEPKLEEAMDDMFAAAAVADDGPLTGIVLDLRNNPGGLLDQSLFVSDAFLDSGVIVSVRERNPRNERVYMAEPGDLSHGLPMVVLINGGSASASEIVAGALKDQGRAVIMGRRSFGKGSVQVIQPLPVEGALKLTIARYYAPSGHTIQARGVSPDIILNGPPQTEGADSPQIRREADLPGVLDGDSMSEKAAEAVLAREQCPKAGPKGEDLELGCALAYLHAGSTRDFLSTMAPVQ